MHTSIVSQGVILDSCKRSMVNSRLSEISKWPIMPRSLGQDEHDMDFGNILLKMYLPS